MKLPRKVEAVFVLASVVAVLAVLAIPAPGYGARPPVEQPLIREGDFAVELARSLNLSTTDDETEAESTLAAAGIAPRNGWMADYPVTPDIVSEIQDSTRQAAKSARIPMDEGSAVRTVQNVLQDMGLPIKVAGAQIEYGPAAASREEYERSDSSYESSSYSAESAPPAYDSPEVGEYYVEDYYYDYGPPVVSYYVPPFDYAYMYSWVPWPFWWGGGWFGGYFVLNDFDVFRGRHHHWKHKGHHGLKGNGRVSNHARDGNGRATRVDPANRLANVRGAGRTGTRLATAAGTSNFQRSGRAIMNRDATRSPRSNTARSAPNGTGSSIAPNHASSEARSTGNAIGRTTNTGRSTAISRQATGRSRSSSGSVSRNPGRNTQGYSAPRTSSGYVSRSAPRTSSGYVSRGTPSSGFRSGGSFSGRSSGGAFSGGGLRSGGSSGAFQGGSHSGGFSGGSSGARVGGGGFGGGSGGARGGGGSHGGGGGRR